VSVSRAHPEGAILLEGIGFQGLGKSGRKGFTQDIEVEWQSLEHVGK
jgi:hypothetical protein